MTVNRQLEKELFEQIASGGKRDVEFVECEIHEGDTLILEEWDHEAQGYTGRKIETTVTAINQVSPVPAGSIDEATKHGSLTVHFELKPSKFTFPGEHQQL